MLNGRPLFIADSSLNHILEVIKVLGTPSREDVRAMNPSYELSEYDLPKIKGKSFKKVPIQLYRCFPRPTNSSSISSTRSYATRPAKE